MKIIDRILFLYESSVQAQVMKHAKDKNLAFELADKGHSTKSIAYSEKNQSWIGFSHRAVAEFKIGDMFFDSKFKGADGKLPEEELEKVPFKKFGLIKVKNMKQAKEAAVNFARSVS